MTDADTAIRLAVQIAKPFEGLRLEPYHCPAGFATIGHGHLLSPKRGAPLDQWSPITEEEADELLMIDMDRALAGVERLITIPLSPPRIAALVDWTYNLGAGRLECSTLRAVINRGEFVEAPSQFMRWIYGGGRVLRGLVRRREAEVDMWLSA